MNGFLISSPKHTFWILTIYILLRSKKNTSICVCMCVCVRGGGGVGDFSRALIFCNFCSNTHLVELPQKDIFWCKDSLNPYPVE